MSETRDPSDCPKCGEWRDASWIDCANCGFTPHYCPCGDPRGACIYIRPHEGDHKVPAHWAIALRPTQDH